MNVKRNKWVEKNGAILVPFLTAVIVGAVIFFGSLLKDVPNV